MNINFFEGARRIVKLVTVLSVIAFVVFAFSGSDPYVTATYLISMPLKEPIRSETGLCELVVTESKPVTAKTKRGTEVHVTLCLTEIDTDNQMQYAEWIVANEDKKGTPEFDLVAQAYRFARQAHLEAALVNADAAGNTDDAKALSDELAKRKRLQELEEKEGSLSPAGWKKDLVATASAAERLRLAKSFQLPKADWTLFDDQWSSKRKENILEGLWWLVGGLTILWVLSWTLGWVLRGFLSIPMGQDRKPDTT